MKALDLASAALLVPCPRCEAPVDEGCRTIFGKPTRTAHASRIDPVIAGWRLGYTDGLRDALAYPESSARSLAKIDAERLQP